MQTRWLYLANGEGGEGEEGEETSRRSSERRAAEFNEESAKLPHTHSTCCTLLLGEARMEMAVITQSRIGPECRDVKGWTSGRQLGLGGRAGKRSGAEETHTQVALHTYVHSDCQALKLGSQSLMMQSASNFATTTKHMQLGSRCPEIKHEYMHRPSSRFLVYQRNMIAHPSIATYVFGMETTRNFNR